MEKRIDGKKRSALLEKIRGQRGKKLALYIVLELLVPYAYLMLCGLVFDRWLHLYQMTTFVFFSYVTLQLAGIAMAVITITKRGRKDGK